MLNKNKQKMYAFIDSQNLNLGVLDMGWKLDFKKFLVYLRDKYKVDKAYLFIGYVSGNESLYTFLQEVGYILVHKPTLEYKKKKKKFTKGNVDAELVLHSMIQIKNYDKAIIVSGDGDFHCLIEYLAKKNKLYKIVIPNNNKYSALLRKYRKYFVYLHQLKNKIGRENSKNKKRGSSLRTKP